MLLANLEKERQTLDAARKTLYSQKLNEFRSTTEGFESGKIELPDFFRTLIVLKPGAGILARYPDIKKLSDYVNEASAPDFQTADAAVTKLRVEFQTRCKSMLSKKGLGTYGHAGTGSLKPASSNRRRMRAAWKNWPGLSASGSKAGRSSSPGYGSCRN